VRLFVAKVIDVHAWRSEILFIMHSTGVRVLKARARACEHEPAPPGKAVLGDDNNHRGFIRMICYGVFGRYPTFVRDHAG
jgi:hypothetical protein